MVNGKVHEEEPEDYYFPLPAAPEDIVEALRIHFNIPSAASPQESGEQVFCRAYQWYHTPNTELWGPREDYQKFLRGEIPFPRDYMRRAYEVLILGKE